MTSTDMKKPIVNLAKSIIQGNQTAELIQELVRQGVKPEHIIEAAKTPKIGEGGLFLNKEMYEGMVQPRRYAKHTKSKLP